MPNIEKTADSTFDYEFSEATRRLVNILLPDAQADERLYAEAAFAQLSRCTVMEAVMQIGMAGTTQGVKK